MPMTRAEALCACRNLIEAIETLDEVLPNDFSSGVHNKTSSMAKYIEGTPQYPHVTEKMDISIRNMWSAVQKWNRRSLANSEMFYGLADVVAETGEPDEEAAGIRAEMEGSETDDFDETAQQMLGGLSEADQARLAAMSAASHTPKVVESKFMDPPAGLNEPSAGNAMAVSQAQGHFIETAAKARENVIAGARNRFREKGINVLPIDKIKHGDLTPVMRLTSSERTRQMLEAAYVAGYIAGAKSTTEELEERLRKNGK
jgi:hypothetical protein